MTQITVPNLTLILTIISIFGIIFSVYLYFRNPQIESDKANIKIKDEIENLKKQILDIKETHLRSVEMDIKTLTNAVNDLSKTVVKLSTIIDERIPRVSL